MTVDIIGSVLMSWLIFYVAKVLWWDYMMDVRRRRTHSKWIIDNTPEFDPMRELAEAHRLELDTWDEQFEQLTGKNARHILNPVNAPLPGETLNSVPQVDLLAVAQRTMLMQQALMGQQQPSPEQLAAMMNMNAQQQQLSGMQALGNPFFGLLGQQGRRH